MTEHNISPFASALIRRGEEVLDKLEEESKNAVLNSEAFLEKINQRQ